ncbi:MAG: TrlF family AAA-like ATPase [Candidatus Eremiobacterota bacterium]
MEISSGARFLKADLHVHTPASSNYNDKDIAPVDIVNRCLTEGLDIIAITDHNEIQWIDMVKKAAEGTGLFVFPGIQITARGGHVLAIFPSDHPAEKMEQLLEKVGITRSKRGKKDVLTDYYIDEVFLKIVKDKGIVIACNVDQPDGFVYELLRNSQRMKVYNDQNLFALEISQPALKNKYSNAKGTEYNRDIACIMGSNSYSLAEIGKSYSYIKMDTISLEGLKQAFLDHQVKIKFAGDKISSTHPRINKLNVSQGFFKEQPFNFHPNLNCLVGGKGVGKSFTIELIRFVFDSQSLFPAIKEDANGKIEKLVGEGGKVELFVEDDRGKFRIERDVNREWSRPRIFRDGEDKPLDANVSNFFKIEAYSQGEIVDIARSRSAQLGIIDSSLDISEEEINEKKLLEELSINATELAACQDCSDEYEEVKEQLTIIHEKIKVLDEKLRDPILKKYQKWLEEKKYFHLVEQGLDEYLNMLIKKLQEVDYENYIPSINCDDCVNTEVMNNLSSFTGQLREEIEKTTISIKDIFDRKKEAISREFSQWSEQFNEAQLNYKKFLAELNVPEVAEAEKEYQEAKEKEMELLQRKASLEKINKGSEEFFAKRYSLLNSLEEILKRKFDKRLQRSQEIEKRLEGKIKIELSFKSVREEYLNKLLLFTQGERISYDDLDKIVQSVYPDKLVKMILDRDHNSLVATAGISEKKAMQIINKLLSINKKELLDMQAVNLCDLIKLKFKENNRYKLIEDLSLGAKCTSIIYIITVGGDCPLIIDQPEDALDTLSVFDPIVKKLREEKERRQFILATHNANIPVVADAELSLVLTASSDSGIIQNGGGLDRPSTRELLLLNLEGGREAFKMRNQKYSFQELTD